MNGEKQDKNLRYALGWLASLIDDWDGRRRALEPLLDESGLVREGGALHLEVIPPNDLAGWYLVLCQTFLDESVRYHHFHGARALPALEAVGRWVPDLRNTPGVEERVRQVLQRRPDQVDGLLFELLVASRYIADGWRVTFLSETHLPSPDFMVEHESSRFFVECKRQGHSDYSTAERRHWREMIVPIAHFLNSARLPIVLDITFHQEVTKVPLEYLERRLLPKLQLLLPPGRLVEDSVAAIDLRYANVNLTRSYLSGQSVKLESALLAYLLFDYVDYHRGISFNVSYRQAPRKPRVVDDVAWGWAAIWSCDAPQAINAKAKAISRQLHDAAKQVKDSQPAVVHVGIEMGDGGEVEEIRAKKIHSWLNAFDPTESRIDHIYIHAFTFLVPPDKNWDGAEICQALSRRDSGIGPPLRDPRLFSAGEPEFLADSD